MNGNILDTNVIIRLLNGDENVRSAIYKMTDICIPVVVVGELLFGEKNRRNASRTAGTTLRFVRRILFWT